MKRVLALFLAAVSFLLPAGASATGQTAERLIVGCDTMSLYALPLMKADSTVLARLEKRLKEIDAPWSTACWRAYIGVWRLDKGRLWLERVETTKGDPVFTGAELFPKSAEGSRPGPTGSAAKSAMARVLWCITNTTDSSGILSGSGSLRYSKGVWAEVRKPIGTVCISAVWR